MLAGKKIANKVLTELKKKIKDRHLKLTLGVIQVGQNAVSKIYLSKKEKAARAIGVDFRLFKFPAKIKNRELAKAVSKINEMPDISGLVIQLPLPENINSQEILNLISFKKDVDCLSGAMLGKFYSGTAQILPPVVGGVIKLLNEYKINIARKKVVIVGAGRLVGKPLAIWFLNQKATISVVNELTGDISSFSKNADILISGAGKPDLITGEMVKRGAIVIDAGSALKAKKMVGDIEPKTVSQKAGYLAAVPGGLGPLTVACLLENLLALNS